MKRDLKADLELCNKATPGPWYRKKTGANFKGFSSEVIIADTSRYATGNKVYAEAKGGQFPANDADFIAQAREGWPHAIERALKAEAEVEKLRAEVERLRRREETILRWLDDGCCPPGIMGNHCPERSCEECGECFREALDREEAREHGKDGNRVD